MTSNPPEQLFGGTRWTVRDVLALFITIIVLGLVFSFWGWAMQVLSRVLGEVAAGLFYGVWFWAGLLLAYAIRKPGAALLAEFCAAIVAYILGSPFGLLILVLGWVQGLALELVFAWVHFRHWGLVTMLVAGALAGTVSIGSISTAAAPKALRAAAEKARPSPRTFIRSLVSVICVVRTPVVLLRLWLSSS